MHTLTRPQRTFLLAGTQMLATASYVQWWIGGGGDKIWLLVLSRMWLSGKALYTDLFQPNLPLITWLYAVPTMLAARTGWLDYHILVVMTLVFSGVSAWLCFRLMAQHPQFTGNIYKQMQHSLLLGFVFIVWTNPAFFGDREHLIVVSIFPYMLRFMPSLANQAFPRRLRIGVAIIAAIGLCVRPQVIMLFAAMQLLYLLQQRSLRIVVSLENIILYSIGALYLLLIISLTTDYFSTMLPMLLATYSETNRGISRIMAYCTSAFMLAVTLAEFRLRHRSPYRADIFYFLGLCFTCLLYTFTGNGWLYTFYPLQSMILFTTAWVLWEFAWLAGNHAARGDSPRQFTFGLRACAANIAFNTFMVFAIYGTVFLPQSYQDKLLSKSRMDKEIIDFIAANHFHNFGMMASSRSIWPEIIDTTHAMLDTRLNNLWMLTKFLKADEAFTKKQRWILDYVAKAYADDLTINKPEIMLVDASDEFYTSGKKLDLIAFFSAYPDFAAAWKHYTLLKVVDHCTEPALKERKHKGLCRYDIYKRVEE